MIRSALRRLLADSTVIYECRSCGTKLDVDAETHEVCPSCGSDEIAEYELTETPVASRRP